MRDGQRGAILESRCCEAGHPYLKRILGLDGLARCFLVGVKSGTSPLITTSTRWRYQRREPLCHCPTSRVVAMAIVLNRMWPFLRYRIRFSCFRKIKTFVDKIDAEGFRSNKKADGFPDFEPRLNGRIGISGFLGPVRRSARSASGSRTVTSSLVQGDNRFNPKTRGHGLPGLRKPARSFPPWPHLSPA